MEKLLLVLNFLFGKYDQSNTLLYLLLAKELGIRTSRHTHLSSLPLNDLAKRAFHENDIITVQQAILAYCLNDDMPGIGGRTWEALLNIVAN